MLRGPRHRQHAVPRRCGLDYARLGHRLRDRRPDCRFLLGRLWVPAEAKWKVASPGLVAGIAFAVSGTIGGYLGLLGFTTFHSPLREASIPFGIWLTYFLGGLLCDLGWTLSCSLSNSARNEPGSKTSEPGEKPTAAGAERERQARKSMIWGFVAMAFLALLVEQVRWPLSLVQLILTSGSIPLRMLGLREVSRQVVFLLLVLGAPALFWGVIARGPLGASRASSAPGDGAERSSGPASARCWPSAGCYSCSRP